MDWTVHASEPNTQVWAVLWVGASDVDLRMPLAVSSTSKHALEFCAVQTLD